MQTIIIRGPAGVGKTTIAKQLATKLDATYISYDKVMKENKLDTIIGDGIPTKNFIKANEIVLLQLKNKNVVLDGCFYREKQIRDLQKTLKPIIFTLTAPVDTCLERNAKREKPLSKEAIMQVHQLVSTIKVGISITTTEKKEEEIIKKIQSIIDHYLNIFAEDIN